MINYNNLKEFVADICKDYTDRVTFITPIHNQYPSEDNDMIDRKQYGTDMFYSPFKGFGKYRINKPYVNIALIPLHKNETFTLPNKLKQALTIASDIEIDIEHIPYQITKLIPFIDIRGEKCYYDSVRKSFSYNTNNVVVYSDSPNALKGVYREFMRKGYTHMKVLYFSTKHYIQ